MSHQVTIQPSGHQFTVQDDETVLAAALRENFALPYGCRNGACGACKGKVLAGEVDYGSHQPATLTADDKAKGMALFCTARPKTDLVIEVKEIGAAKDIPIKTLPCRIEKMEKLADDVMALWLKLPSSERLQFLPGQYIDFLLKDGKQRSFSLANAPEEDQLLELHIRHVPGGFFTDQVFGTMKAKDIMRIKGPLGSFFLRESDKPALFLAGGTGFAPIKSILAHAFQHGIGRQMVLYWGAKSLADLYQPQLPAGWQQAHDNFRFIPVLSEPKAADNWPGRTGHVHQAVLADIADLSGWQVYACGAPAMIEAAKRDFMARGLPEDEFYSDAFSFQ
ncbi:CDP-6-deoxy-delta-3,4-glucoseen reductase [Parasulfuritortus cantonensis]|uniref:CDP-6-deoxy-delta-3,4-glucoseen reductase n=1 Tax=Parasulfuritortus cantonensis TaxID=2528202 RepID=A0A4R1B6M7_9PROT|nr:CDP-6-deoxy-delta-3,4-glucoseen reductase [Parasulfuritortus cantonensis]TCJ11948.1 CDP-6-deoxy-delta-3,4-glucoseen reductase [Parasulfuritortus cantonensis]